MSTVSDILTSETNYTKQMQAATDTLTGAASENLGIADFLQLLTQQLQAQDPTSSSDSNQTQSFVSQICQFSQLEVSTETYDVINSYVGEQKAEGLLGEGVVLQDPSDSKKTISGEVEAVYHDGAKSAITVDGKTYSMDTLLYTYDKTLVTQNSTASTGTTAGTGSTASGSKTSGT